MIRTRIKEQILKLRSEGNTYNQIQEKLKCSKATISYYLNPQRKNKVVAANRSRRLNDRKKIKQLYGGKCSKCGYSKCLAALQFHHIDPKNKKFGITNALRKNTKNQFTKQEILEECNKCILLCSNCHFELHYPE